MADFDGFEVSSVEIALKIAVVGLVAGILFYALEKYVLTPAEAAVGLSTPVVATNATAA